MQKLDALNIVILSFYLTSCGPAMQVNQMQGQNIDAGLSRYLSEFQSQGVARGVATDASHLTMSFSESMPLSSIPNGFVLAYCQRTPQGPNVVVKGSAFNSMAVSDREQIVMHELGHCLLGLEHDNSTETAFWYGYNPLSPATTVPSSIMNELHFWSALYDGNRATYLDRLFKRAIPMPLYWNAPPQLDTTIYN